MNLDQQNACVELVGASMALMSVVRLLEHREVRGVFWPSAVFNLAFGLWALHFYRVLTQPYSFAVQLVWVCATATWVALRCWFAWKGK